MAFFRPFAKLVLRASVNASAFLALPVFLALLYAVEPFWRIRLIWMQDERIGHLSYNIDLFVRRLRLDGHPPRTSFLFLASAPCNRQLLDMWKRVLPVVESHSLRRFLQPIWPFMARTRFCPNLRPRWNEHRELALASPNIHFTEEEEERGRRLLAEMGIGPDDWFICFHARDPAYLTRDQGDDRRYLHRNSSVANYMKAAEHVARLGGYAIRMGAVVAEPLPQPRHPRIIDYATCRRSDFMDIYLAAKCRFFLGNNSGLYLTRLLFNGWAGSANWSSLYLVGLGPRHIFSPKSIWSKADGRQLSFAEIHALGLMNTDPEAQNWIDMGDTYENLGLEMRESTPDEILDLCKDLLDHTEGREAPPEAVRLQGLYARSFFPDHPNSGPHAGRIAPRYALRRRDLITAGPI